MTSRMRWGTIVAGTALLLAAGCGESPSVTVYKQGQYQGKPDTRPWDGANFNGDRAAWEKAIKARNEGQNEYSRVVSK
jgi:hypothetical protein